MQCIGDGEGRRGGRGKEVANERLADLTRWCAVHVVFGIATG